MPKSKPAKTPAPQTKAEMESVVREICRLRNRERQLTASLDAEMRRVREKFEAPLAEITAQLESQTASARAWAERNPGKFCRRRSVDFMHGIVGFRLGPPKVRPVGRSKWETVLQALREAAWGLPYIRVKEEINKEKLIADTGEGLLPPETLRQAGAQIVSEELFYVEPRASE